MHLNLLKLLVILLLVSCLAQISAQNTFLSSKRLKKLIFTSMPNNTLQLDSLSIAPNSLSIRNITQNKNIDSSQYVVNYWQASLQWKTSQNINDSILISYRVFPINLSQNYTHKNIKQIQALGDQPYGNPFKYEVKPFTVNDIFADKGLDYSGSFGRGISFGNSQSVVVNSNFNLQIAGKLQNEIEILGAISDNNIPFQPEGNTQQIQEFDRIFIQLKKNNHTLLLGDYDLSPSGSYFMQFIRKLQGIQYTNSLSIKKITTLNSNFSTAISKGNYRRQTVSAIEGNQGPYKLNGANGESFIMILSGTEKVYLNGKLLVRGYNNDYVIDYNTAEITFSNKILITYDKRIIVEFEYADRSFFRTLLFGNFNANINKWNFTAAVFTEQDSKNQPLSDGVYTNERINILKNAGDSPSKWITASASQVPYTNNRILYELKDTLIANVIYDSIYVYSKNPEKAHYSLIFSDVGYNNGNYLLSNDQINGRIFKWVAPDSISGSKQGNYEPIVQLVTPKLQQLYTFTSKFNITENQKISAEIALSNTDLNSFSKLDDKNNIGTATHLNYENSIKLSPSSKIICKAEYEWKNKYFEALNSYRNVEFVRDWNIVTANIKGNSEHLSNINLQLNAFKILQLSYNFSNFLQYAAKYKGIKNTFNAVYTPKNWQILGFCSYLISKDSTLNTTFLRPNVAISKSFNRFMKGLTIGTKASIEQNIIKLNNNNNLSNNSKVSKTWSVNIATPDTNAVTIHLDLSKRWDYRVKLDKLCNSTIGNTFSILLGLNKNPNNQLSTSFTYHQLLIADSTLTTQKEDETYLSNIDYTFSLFKGFIRSSMQYQLGSGQTQKNEYFYQNVEKGKGTYIWKDLNFNSIEEINEFETAAEIDQLYADYIRIILPTNQYQKTNLLQFNETLNISPKSLWVNAKGLYKGLSILSLQSNINLQRNTISDIAGFQSLIPISINIPLTAVVFETANFLNTLYINRSNSAFEFSVYDLRNTNTTLLLGGVDGRKKTENGLASRVSLGLKLSALLDGSAGKIQNFSEAFDGKNYTINYYSVLPGINFQPNTQWAAGLSYQYKQSTSGALKAIFNKFNLDWRYGNPTQNSIHAKLSFTLLNSQNIVNQNSIAYTLLDGFESGKNFTWLLYFDTKLANNIIVSIGYDGKKSENSKIVHVGRASVRAVF